MRRYLDLAEAKAVLNRGKQVEQFLGGFLSGDDPAIRYTVVRSEQGKFVATIYERFEPSHSGFFDVGEFQSVDPDDDPEDFYFDSIEDAYSFLATRAGASETKFVNQGMVDEEYRDFQKAKTLDPQ